VRGGEGAARTTKQATSQPASETRPRQPQQRAPPPPSQRMSLKMRKYRSVASSVASSSSSSSRNATNRSRTYARIRRRCGGSWSGAVCARRVVVAVCCCARRLMRVRACTVGHGGVEEPGGARLAPGGRVCGPDGDAPLPPPRLPAQLRRRGVRDMVRRRAVLL
jgi:hypothetical protein